MNNLVFTTDEVTYDAFAKTKFLGSRSSLRAAKLLAEKWLIIMTHGDLGPVFWLILLGGLILVLLAAASQC